MWQDSAKTIAAAADSAVGASNCDVRYPLYEGARGEASLFTAGRLHGLILAGRTPTRHQLHRTEAMLAARPGVALAA